jgi:hypothetical protein
VSVVTLLIGLLCLGTWHAQRVVRRDVLSAKHRRRSPEDEARNTPSAYALSGGLVAFAGLCLVAHALS